MPIAAPGFGASADKSQKTTFLNSIAGHRYVLAATLTALLPSEQVLAQCAPPPPAAVSISSGSCEDVAFTARESAGTVVEVTGTASYSATSTHLLVTGNGYGAYASGGGTISLTGMPDDSTTQSEITTYGIGSHALYADGGGLITSDNTIIYTNDAGAHGVGAVGAGSRVTLSDGALNTSNDGSHGAYAASGGTISLTRTDIQTYGVGASAAFVDAGGSITLDNLNTYSNGDDSPGAVASGAGSGLTLNNTYVNVMGNDGAGLLAIGGGTIVASGGAIATGDYYGGTVIANTPGIVARGGGSSIQVRNGATSATYGANSPGVWADAGARIDFSGYGIFTYQPNSPGAAASGAGSTITLTDTIVRTSGPSSAGLRVTSAGTIIMTGTQVTTGFRVSGGNPPVLQFPDAEIGVGAHGADVAGPGNRLEAENNDITTTGNGAVGVRVSQGGTASIAGGTITTYAGDADGVRVTDAGSTVTLTGTIVRTSGPSSAGLRVTSAGTIVVTGTEVTTGFKATGGNSPVLQFPDAEIGVAAHGADVAGLGSRLEAKNDDITTTGNGAVGVKVSQGGTASIAGGTITTYAGDADGVRVTDAGSTVTLTGTIVRTSGPFSAGLRVTSAGTIVVTGTEVTTGFRVSGSNPPVLQFPDAEIGVAAHGADVAGLGSRLEAKNDDITTTGNGAVGVKVSQGGTASIAGGTITTYGANTVIAGDADGVRVTDAGSTVTLNGTIVRTSGPSSAGLRVTNAGTIVVTGTEVTTGFKATGGNSPVLQFPDAEIGVAAHGADVAGPGSRLEAKNARITTTGNGAVGVRVSQGGTASITGGTITTYAGDADGVRVTDAGSTVTLTDTTVRTSGPSSAGLRVTSAGTIVVTGTQVTTGFRVSGGNPPVLQFPDAEIGVGAHGADVAGPGSRLEAENNDITTTGNRAVGVKVSQGGTASIAGGTITTYAGDADGVRATDAGSNISLNGTSVTTTGINAVGLHATARGTIAASNVTVATQGQRARGVEADNAGGVQIAGGSVTTAGSAAHGIAAVNGGTLATTDTAIAVSGAGSTAIYLAGSAPGTVSVTGGSLSATGGAIVLAEGGTGTISIGGGTAITPAVVNGRPLLALVTEDAVGNPAKLTLNIAGLPSLTGDIVVDPSTLSYNLDSSRWAGNLVLTGPGNAASAKLAASQWTGDLLADAGNTADVKLALGSLWTGLARNATGVAIDGSSGWSLTGNSNVTGAVTNAGLIQFLARPGAYSTLTVGSYAGNNGRIAFNTYLGADNSPTNLLVIDGGQASGTTSVLVSNTGGPGAQTAADGIRLVQVTGGGTTTTDAFTLGQRVTAGAYEYQLFRGGSSSADDWFLRSYLIDPPTNPTEPSGPDIPLYRPEAALYAPIPAIGRQMGLATVGTLHERVGEEENIRALTGRGYANGGWGRVFGERTRNRWDGTVDSRAAGDLVGLQAGLDIIRTNPYAGGHRDHLGVYGAYTDYNAPSVSGFALGIENLRVGRLSMAGPSIGAYWTHFGPSGWYVDAVFQRSWYDINARSDYGAGLSTDATGYTASLEAGYPIRFGEGNRWQIEPQAQIISQTISVEHSSDAYSGVSWNEGHAWTGRFGARLQYTDQDAHGTLWQPYARFNLWHAFSGNDSAVFVPASPTIETRFGDTALEIGGGVTARINQNVSFYGQGSYRWSLDGGRSRQTATAGTIGMRFNW